MIVINHPGMSLMAKKSMASAFNKGAFIQLDSIEAQLSIHLYQDETRRLAAELARISDLPSLQGGGRLYTKDEVLALLGQLSFALSFAGVDQFAAIQKIVDEVRNA